MCSIVHNSKVYDFGRDVRHSVSCEQTADKTELSSNLRQHPPGLYAMLQVCKPTDLKMENLNLEQMKPEEQNFNEPQNQQLNIPAVIRSYSDKGIFIEVLADGYKLDGVGICWRGYVYWKQDDKWVEEECGCYPDWIDAFNSSIKFINDCVLYNCI